MMPLFSVNTMFAGGIVKRKTKKEEEAPPIEFDTFYNYGNVITGTTTGPNRNYRFALAKNSKWNPANLNNGIFRFTFNRFSNQVPIIQGMSCGFSNGGSFLNYAHTPVRITVGNNNTWSINGQTVSDEIDLGDYLSFVDTSSYFIYHVYQTTSGLYFTRFQQFNTYGYFKSSPTDETMNQNVTGYGNYGTLYHPCQLIEEG